MSRITVWAGLACWLWGCGDRLERGADLGECPSADCGLEPEDDPQSCDLIGQDDCAEGEKCTVGYPTWPEDAWAAECLPLMGDQPEGGVCDLYHTGQDECAAGLWCWSWRCRAYCDLDSADGCGEVGLDDHLCIPIFDEAGLCVAACDPNDATTCDPGNNCSRYAGGWACIPAPAVPDDEATCSADWQCAVGFACVGATSRKEGSCYLRCDLEAEQGCGDGETCTALSSSGDHPEAGACMADDGAG